MTMNFFKVIYLELHLFQIEMQRNSFIAWDDLQLKSLNVIIFFFIGFNFADFK